LYYNFIVGKGVVAFTYKVCMEMPFIGTKSFISFWVWSFFFGEIILPVIGIDGGIANKR